MTDSTPEREIATVSVASVEVAIAQFVRIIMRLTVALAISACLPLVGWFTALLVGNTKTSRKTRREVTR